MGSLYVPYKGHSASIPPNGGDAFKGGVVRSARDALDSLAPAPIEERLYDLSTPKG